MLEDKPEVLCRLHAAVVPVVARAWPYNADVLMSRISNLTDFAHLVYGGPKEII